jgi:predicted NUDIX family NTP pyrophosphohydrolase
MKRMSAGLLMFRRHRDGVEVLLVHPGGPVWKNKNLGSWSIPKGEQSEGEEPLDAARREFQEETGLQPDGECIYLDKIKQPSGKIVKIWALEGDCSPDEIRSNLFSMEWPPKSGRTQEFPEVDRAEWFSLEKAKTHILKGQAAFLDRLVEQIGVHPQENDDDPLVGP